MVKVRVDMTGWKMWEHGLPESRLTVIEQAEDYVDPKGRHFAKWLCECSCEDHNKVCLKGINLKNGLVLSCGCLQKENLRNAKKKYNKYDLSGEYGIGWTSNTNKEFYFDLEDYDKVKDICWLEVKIGHGRGITTLKGWSEDVGADVTMHQLLGYFNYDHINRNELDNRKENLRPCTKQENSINRGIQSNNTSGVTGVGWYKAYARWYASLTINGKSIHLGYFDNKDDAIRARLNAEVKYFGEFAPQQHLYEQYGIKTPQNDCAN